MRNLYFIIKSTKFNIMRKYIIPALLLLLFAEAIPSQSVGSKFLKWQTPSYFRGYNVLYESPHTLQDFIDFKNYGGNFFQIGTFGWQAEDPPYAVNQQNINGTDLLVNYCRQAGLHYTIAVRSGPGAYDTYLESEGITGESRIWESSNSTERELYKQMLGNIVSRYSGDSLFVGIVLVVEPRPKVKLIPSNKSETYKFFLENIFNIHMDRVYQEFVEYIRTIDTEIPAIVENFAYSTPELFPAYKIEDPYIIYSAHNYQPNEYTKAELIFSRTYPGSYFNLTYLSQMYYDKDFISKTVFGRLKEFEESTGNPVLLGEFGMLYPQYGASQYIGDVLDICIENGWHFALWDWRRGSGKNWNIENFQDTTGPPKSVENDWTSVLKRFHPPPVPVQVYPLDANNEVELPVNFQWNPLTTYTRFDLEIYHGSQIVDSIISLQNANYVYDGLLGWGRSYSWRMRSKNPGGTEANKSAWSPLQTFTIINEGGIVKPGNTRSLVDGLVQNHPNPFNPSTNISYSVKSPGLVKLIVYDLIGREVKTLVNKTQNDGAYSVVFDASNLPSGVYIYKLEIVLQGSSERFSEVKRMVLLK